MPELRVGDFLTRRREVVLDVDDQDYRQVTISLNHGGVRLRGVKPGAEIGTKRQYLTRSGDFILSRIDARNAAFGIVPDDLDGAVITNDFWSFEIDREQVDLDYFYLLSQTDAFLDACVRSSTGTTNRQRIQAEFFLDYVFEVPPLAEQARAVERYRSLRGPLDTITDALDRQAADLDALRQRILDDAVRGQLTERDPDDEPAEAMLARIAEEKRRRYEAGEIRKPKKIPPVGEDERPFEVPEGWAWTRLGLVGEVVGGGTPKSDNPAFWAEPGSGVTWLTPADLNGNEQKIAPAGRRDVSESGLENSSARLLPIGSVLFSSRAPIGYVAVTGVELSTNQGFKSIVPYDACFTDYLYWFLRQAGPSIDAAASGTTFREVSGKVVARVPIPFPPVEEQRRIVARVDALLALCDSIAERLASARTDAERLTQTVLAEALRL